RRIPKRRQDAVAKKPGGEPLRQRLSRRERRPVPIEQQLEDRQRHGDTGTGDQSSSQDGASAQASHRCVSPQLGGATKRNPSLLTRSIMSDCRSWPLWAKRSASSAMTAASPAEFARPVAYL